MITTMEDGKATTTISVRDAPPVPAAVRPSQQTKIAISDFSFFYGTFKALHNITLDVPDKQVTAFIGPSGCGKSTFLRSINRMNDIIPEARPVGSIAIDGKDVYAPGTDVVELRRRVGSD